MKRSDLKELIKKSMLEVSPTSGAMTPEEEEMVAGYEEEEANKYALDKEEPMEEDILREADDIVATWAEKQTMNEEMHGGYLELLEMNPDFEQGARLLLNAWFEWKEGPMTEPYMVEEAKQDILAYLSSMMK
tara:strand:- start:193 stop:588 length:396 start_codon:yes stop_codon:yes gene_type:complete